MAVLVSWLLLLLLLINSALESGGHLDCRSGSSLITMQLKASDLVRTWQNSSAADCDVTGFPRWLQVTDEFPAAVRHQHRWLVMQLRRPMLVERVSWGHPGSRVSAFGAASLPLELQLQDPCRASYEVFAAFQNWELVGRENARTGISYILVNASEESANFSWSGFKLTGKWQPLEIETLGLSEYCLNTNFMNMRLGDSICFTVATCTEGNISCQVESASGAALQLQNLKPPIKSHSGLITQYFELKAATHQHGASLICEVTGKPETRAVQTLGIIIEPQRTEHSVPLTWVSDRNVTVELTTVEGYPESLHCCFINSSRLRWNMTKVSQNRKILSSLRNLTVITVRTKFSIKVSPSMLNGSLTCTENFVDSLTIKEIKLLNITAISAPCVTKVDLASTWPRPDGEVMQFRVTSRNCSTWNVTHTCWLAGAHGSQVMLLNKIEQGSFNSIHQFVVGGWMGQNGWSVRCGVNQSGIVYDDVGLEIGKLENFERILLISALAVSLSAVSLLLGCAVACLRKLLSGISDAQLVCASEIAMSTIDTADCCRHETDLTTLTSSRSRRSQFQGAGSFVKVVVVLTRTNDASGQKTGEVEDEEFTQVAGHYEADGCTFYEYDLASTATLTSLID